MHIYVSFTSKSWRLNCCSPSLSAVLFPVVADPSNLEQWRVPFPLAKQVADLVFPFVVHTPKPLEFSQRLFLRFVLGRAKPIGGVKKTQTSKTHTSDPKKLGALEKRRPLSVSKTPTLNIFQILQLTVVREQPLSLSHPQKRMVLQKYRLSENSHRQTISTKPNFWSRAMKFCSNRWAIRP